MENKVIFRDNQELQAADFLNQQEWAQEALDHVVLDTIHGGKAYSGFTLSKTGSTTITTSPGRLYSSGAVYARNEVVNVDLFNQLPVTTKKYFAIVAWGQTIEEDIQPREFLIDADTGASEPQSVAMQETRYCNVNSVAGIESADPQFPVIDANVLLIGYVLTDPTGIVSFVQATETQVDNLALLGERVSDLEAQNSIFAGMIATLRTDLANLARQLLLYTPLEDFNKLVDLVQLIYDRVFRPGVFIYYGTDRFLDTSQSLTAGSIDGAYSARVEEGLRFPGGGVGWQGPLALLNPSEPTIQSWSGFTLPKPSGARVRFDCSFQSLPWLPVRILTFGWWAFTVRHLTPARWRHRCGPHYLPQPEAQIWRMQATVDIVQATFMFVGETWTAIGNNVVVVQPEWSVYYPRAGYDRFIHFWRDWVNLPHWARVYTDFSHNGNHIVQTFYNAQDGWLSGITLFSNKANYAQPLTLVISGCLDDGTPDHDNHTLRRVVLDGPGVSACFGAPILAGDIITTQLVVTQTSTGYQDYIIYRHIPTYVYPLRINFPPVFLHAGHHFGVHVHSLSDHEFHFCDDRAAFAVHQGHLWHVVGGRLVVYQTTPRTLRFMAHFATWSQWGQQTSPGGLLRYEVNLAPLQLAGGIGSVDVIAESIIPAATDFNYEVQVDGVWQAFRQDAVFIDGSDALLPFRAVFTGTTDLMPGVNLTNSQVTLERAAATTYHHISTSITLGTPTNTIKVIEKAQSFVEANHDWTISIHYGSTNKAADVVADETLADGTVMRTCTFNVSSVSAFYVKTDGVTNGTGENFVVKERIAYAT